jgi:hypothetical protein
MNSDSYLGDSYVYENTCSLYPQLLRQVYF